MLLGQLSDTWNIYENLAQHMMSFATLVALNASQETSLFALMSQKGFDRKVNGHKSQLLDLWSATIGKVVTPPTEFFASELYLPFGAEHSFVTIHPGRVEPIQKKCRGTPFAKAYAEWLASILIGGWPKRPHTATFHVVFHRRSSGLKRVMTNEKELLSALERRSGPPPYRTITAIDNTELSVRQQYAAVAASDTLVATHGASITWLLALRPQCAQVLELGGDSHHYANMALHFGIRHRFMPGPSHPTDKFEAKISEVLQGLDAVEVEWRACMSLSD